MRYVTRVSKIHQSLLIRCFGTQRVHWRTDANAAYTRRDALCVLRAQFRQNVRSHLTNHEAKFRTLRSHSPTISLNEAD